MKICARLFLHIFPFIEIFGENHRIVQIDIRHNLVICICNIWLKRKHVNRSFVSKKIFRRNFFYEKHIIIEINKIFCQPFNAMKIPLNRMGTKGRKKFRRNKNPRAAQYAVWDALSLTISADAHRL